MKKNSISLIILGFIFITIIMSTTDWRNSLRGAQEINKLDFVQVAGLDYDELNRKYTISTASAKNQPSSGSGDMGSNNEGSNTGNENNLFVSQGESFYDADQNFDLVCNQNIFFGHSKCILLGEDIVKKQDIGGLLDFFVRNHQNRLDVDVVIVRGMTANELMLVVLSGGEDISTKAGTLLEVAGEQSYSQKISLYELVDMLNNKYESSYLPFMFVYNNILDKPEKKGDQDVKIDGYAIIKNMRLFGYIENKTARGVNWIINKIKTGVLVVKDDTGKKISLEIVEAKSQIEVNYSEDLPDIEINIELMTNITEQHSQENIYTNDKIMQLIEKQNEATREEIESALEYCQNNHVDILGIGDKIYHKYPLKWEKIKEQWQDDIFPEIKINVNITSKIRGVYTIQQPLGYDNLEEDKKK